MTSKLILSVLLCGLICRNVIAQDQNLEQSLSETAKNLAAQVKTQEKKKVAVLDFTDLQGGSSELGKYVAEQLTINLVMEKREFAVLDRANLRRVLSEHKLTATGLIDPENAKKLGMFAGVDALIFGNLVPLSQHVEFTAKIITTDTAEIVGATRSKFKIDETVKELLSHPAEGAVADGGGGAFLQDASKVTKTVGDLRVELSQLRLVNGSELALTFTLSNQNPRSSLYVALHYDAALGMRSLVTDSSGNEFRANVQSLSGLAFTTFSEGQRRFGPYNEIKPKESITATLKFTDRNGRRPHPGNCNLQLGVVVGHDFDRSMPGEVGVKNIITDIKAISPD